MATIGSFLASAAKNSSVSSIPSRAPWVQAAMQAPQPIQASCLMLTFSPLPSMQYLTGQAARKTTTMEWDVRIA